VIEVGVNASRQLPATLWRAFEGGLSNLKLSTKTRHAAKRVREIV
jgi:hypothetical protein